MSGAHLHLQPHLQSQLCAQTHTHTHPRPSVSSAFYRNPIASVGAGAGAGSSVNTYRPPTPSEITTLPADGLRNALTAALSHIATLHTALAHTRLQHTLATLASSEAAARSQVEADIAQVQVDVLRFELETCKRRGRRVRRAWRVTRAENEGLKRRSEGSRLDALGVLASRVLETGASGERDEARVLGSPVVFGKEMRRRRESMGSDFEGDETISLDGDDENENAVKERMLDEPRAEEKKVRTVIKVVRNVHQTHKQQKRIRKVATGSSNPRKKLKERAKIIGLGTPISPHPAYSGTI